MIWKGFTSMRRISMHFIVGSARCSHGSLFTGLDVPPFALFQCLPVSTRFVTPMVGCSQKLGCESGSVFPRLNVQYPGGSVLPKFDFAMVRCCKLHPNIEPVRSSKESPLSLISDIILRWSTFCRLSEIEQFFPSIVNFLWMNLFFGKRYWKIYQFLRDVPRCTFTGGWHTGKQ